MLPEPGCRGGDVTDPPDTSIGPSEINAGNPHQADNQTAPPEAGSGGLDLTGRNNLAINKQANRPVARATLDNRCTHLGPTGEHPRPVEPERIKEPPIEQVGADRCCIPGCQNRLWLDQHHPGPLSQQVEPQRQEQPRRVGVGADQTGEPLLENLTLHWIPGGSLPQLSQKRWVADDCVKATHRAAIPHRDTITERVADHHAGDLIAGDPSPRGEAPTTHGHRNRIDVGPKQPLDHDLLPRADAQVKESAGGCKEERPTPTCRIHNGSTRNHLGNQPSGHLGRRVERTKAAPVIRPEEALVDAAQPVVTNQIDRLVQGHRSDDSAVNNEGWPT